MVFPLGKSSLHSSAVYLDTAFALHISRAILTLTGHPAGMVRMSVGTFLCSNTIFSSHLNLIINSFNCFLVSSSLSCELARACSKATRWSCTESGNACCVGFMVRKHWGGIQNREVHGKGAGHRWSPTLGSCPECLQSHSRVSQTAFWQPDYFPPHQWRSKLHLRFLRGLQRLPGQCRGA